MAVEVYRVPVSKERLAPMPRHERTLMIQLGHVENELNTLVKLIGFAGNGNATAEIQQYAEASQISVLIRLLIGKLCESWELFRTKFLSNREVSKRYLPQFDEPTSAALDRLKLVFGHSGLLIKIRNEYAFHVPPDDAIEDAFEKHPESEKWDFYMSSISANSYYHLSEQLVSSAMFGSAGFADNVAALDAVYDRVVQVSSDMRNLFGNCLGLMVHDRITDGSDMVVVMTVADAPKMQEVAIPFYLDETGPTAQHHARQQEG